jgi:hypothetical protein
MNAQINPNGMNIVRMCFNIILEVIQYVCKPLTKLVITWVPQLYTANHVIQVLSPQVYVVRN